MAKCVCKNDIPKWVHWRNIWVKEKHNKVKKQTKHRNVQNYFLKPENLDKKGISVFFLMLNKTFYAKQCISCWTTIIAFKSKHKNSIWSKYIKMIKTILLRLQLLLYVLLHVLILIKTTITTVLKILNMTMIILPVIIKITEYKVI